VENYVSLQGFTLCFEIAPLAYLLTTEFHDVSASPSSREEDFGGWKSKGIMTLGILN